MKRPTIGFVGFGEINSPRDLILRKCAAAQLRLEQLGMEVMATEPVTDDPAGTDVRRAIGDLSARGWDVLVICIAGWIPSHAVIGVISRFQHMPMVLWGLGGHYEGNRLVTTADQAGTTALRKVMDDLGYRFLYCYDWPGKPSRMEKVDAFIRAASATRRLKSAKIGMMGYRDMNLYATLIDAIGLKKVLGIELESFEMLEMTQRASAIAPAEVEALVNRVTSNWTFESPALPETLGNSVRYYLALRQIIEERRYDAVSLIDVDGMKKLLGLPPAMILMLIADEMGLPTIPENDGPGAVTQLIVRYLTGQVAAYFEFYEFMEDRVLIGVPDYVPAAVAEGGVRVRPTRFGGFGEGVLNVSKVKPGRITLVRLLPHHGSFALHAVTGEAVPASPWEEAGWQPPAPQLPSLEVILDRPVEEFAQAVGGQHYILAYGDVTEDLKAFCKLNDLPFL